MRYIHIHTHYKLHAFEDCMGIPPQKCENRTFQHFLKQNGGNTGTVSRPIVSSSVGNVQQQQKWKL